MVKTRFEHVFDMILEGIGSAAEDNAKFPTIEKKLTKCKFLVFQQYPFFSHIMSKMDIILCGGPAAGENGSFNYEGMDKYPNLGLQTMAVDKEGNLYINVGFGMSLPIPEFVGVLLHEIMHVATLTFFRQGPRKHKLWNIATDCAINRDLMSDGVQIPDLAIKPDSQGRVKFKVKKKADPNGSGWGNAAARMGGEVHEEVYVDINGKSAEQIYDEILEVFKQEAEEQKKKQKPPGGTPGGPPPPGGEPSDEEDEGEGETEGGSPEEPGKDGDGISVDDIIDEIEKEREKLDKHLDKPKKPGEGGDGPEGDEKKPNEDGPPGGSGRGDGDASQTPQKRKDENYWKKAITEAGEAAKRSGNPMKGALGDIMAKIVKPQVNWKEVLRNLIRTTTSSSQYNMRRVSRTGYGAGAFIPAMKHGKKADIAVAIDTSGSISTKDYSEFISEILSIAKMFSDVKFTVLFWHTNVHKVLVVDKTTVNDLIKQQFESGGTILGCVADYINKTKMKPACTVYFTDGLVESNPTLPNTPKVFIISTQGNDHVLKKYGKCVQLH